MEPRSINSIVVFCGSNVGRGAAFIDAANRLLSEIARRGSAIAGQSADRTADYCADLAHMLREMARQIVALPDSALGGVHR